MGFRNLRRRREVAAYYERLLAPEGPPGCEPGEDEQACRPQPRERMILVTTGVGICQLLFGAAVLVAGVYWFLG
jgi:hypothetical protein